MIREHDDPLKRRSVPNIRSVIVLLFEVEFHFYVYGYFIKAYPGTSSCYFVPARSVTAYRYNTIHVPVLLCYRYVPERVL